MTTLAERGICAHRGASVTHPENTLPAFQEAIRLGAHMIEFDVDMSRDGCLVLIHDDTVERTTNGRGTVSELTVEQLKRLDAGVKTGEQFRGTEIPTLGEALAIMPQNVWLDVHLRGGPEVAIQTALALAEEQRLHQAFLACDSAQADCARKVVPHVNICSMEGQSNSTEYVDATIESKSSFIQLYGEGEVSPHHIRRLKSHGIRITYFYADYEGEGQTITPEGTRDLLSAGVDFVLVDDPAAILKVAAELGIAPLQPILPA